MLQVGRFCWLDSSVYVCCKILYTVSPERTESVCVCVCDREREGDERGSEERMCKNIGRREEGSLPKIKVV